ncbi:PRC-barrel domain-containing protein [Thalassospira australica]|uniref:PRC-barrel domain-containing protein n=1 Tax=Thalassospira australica TaxID=1528106 RepID=UPI00384C34B8
MARTLLISTAIATLLTSGAIAQTATTAPAADPGQAPPEMEMVVHASGHLASELMGKSVYNQTGADAQDIGEVTDIVVNNDGEIEALVVGVGGFLGIGQKEVALQYDLAKWTEQDDARRLVIETNADALQALDEFDRSAFRPMPADANVNDPKPATEDEVKAAEQEAAAKAAREEAEAAAPVTGN